MPKLVADLDPMLKGLPARLKKAREKREVSLRDLQDKSDVSRSVLSNLEAGRCSAGVSANVLMRIARALRVDPCWFLTGKGKSKL